MRETTGSSVVGGTHGRAAGMAGRNRWKAAAPRRAIPASGASLLVTSPPQPLSLSQLTSAEGRGIDSEKKINKRNHRFLRWSDRAGLFLRLVSARGFSASTALLAPGFFYILGMYGMVIWYGIVAAFCLLRVWSFDSQICLSSHVPPN